MRSTLLTLAALLLVACGSSQSPADPDPAPTPPPADAAATANTDAGPPCDSHTTCYVTAKDAHATGEKSGYQIAARNCGHYRGAYQLEKFYGLCLLILADSYLHLGDFAKARDNFQRVLDTHADDPEMAQTAQDGINELDIGDKEPTLYARYLKALALLARYNHTSDASHLPKAKEIFAALKAENSTWGLSEYVDMMLEQVEATLAAGAETPAAAADGT